ncbi:MAG: hypothetical protein KAI43_12270 [Candidatus Aureabacteria bacterium]|nr:hypothetical protein [Candidatus Auribacterota bacterium]
MQKISGLFLAIAIIALAGVLLVKERYQVIGTSSKNIIVFDKLGCSFITKNAKGEWVKQSIKEAEILVNFKSPGIGDSDTSTESPDDAPDIKPDLKI